MIERPEDRLAFLDPDGFGTLAVFTINGAQVPNVPGQFHNAHAARDMGFHQGAQMSGVEPSIIVRTEDVPGIRSSRDAVRIDGVEYDIHDVKPDGTGMTNLRLMEA